MQLEAKEIDNLVVAQQSEELVNVEALIALVHPKREGQAGLSNVCNAAGAVIRITNFSKTEYGSLLLRVTFLPTSMEDIPQLGNIRPLC